MSHEDLYGTLAQYYGLPTVSLRDAVWLDCEYRRPGCPGGWTSIMNSAVGDNVHPSDVGHRCVAVTACHVGHGARMPERDSPRLGHGLGHRYDPSVGL